MNAVTAPPKTLAPKPRPSAAARLAARCSGSAVSILIHGGLMLAAFLSVAAPGNGRGGGTVGTTEEGSGPRAYSAIVQRESTLNPERTPDSRLFPQALPEPESPDPVIPPAEDFIRDPSENGIPIEKVPPVEDPVPQRPKRTYEKLPPSGGSETADGPPRSGGEQKATST